MLRNKKYSLLSILIWFLAGCLIYEGSKKTIGNYQLANSGHLSKGIVTSRMKVGAKGTIWIEYEFETNNIEYVGHTTNERYETGDSILILHLLSNPEINRSYTFIKENYKTKIIP